MAEIALPQEPTWKLLAASPDMMDVQFCNKRFPFRWRTSLAVWAFEPGAADPPVRRCEGRITFLKVTATITGYQPSREETEAGFVSFPDVPVEELQRILGQYFGCYGALLTVAVFPVRRGEDKGGGPHIIDVEPKIRELVQSASETGEILTSSKSNVKTNKSLTHTESSETGWELTASGGVKDKFNVGGKLSHKNTETEQDTWSVATDASRERQEKEGSTTQISQLYNLLSSYHIGTNRAQFLMLARPHFLQPTDHRTFVDGLRQIEGVQEFLVICARPETMDDMAVEVSLETGHYPEGLVPEAPPDEFEEREEEFTVTAFADNGTFSGDTTTIKATHDVESGFVVDTRAHRDSDPGHPGMKEIANNSNGQANRSLENYNYRRIADATVEVSGRISGQSLQRDKARFNRTYRVFTRSVAPKPNTGGPKVPTDRLLITGRSLCVTFTSGEQCPDPRPFVPRPSLGDLTQGILDEATISITRDHLRPQGPDDTRLPAMHEFLAEVKSALVTSGRLPQRHDPESAPGFLDTDYFKDKIRPFLSPVILRTRAADVSALAPEVAKALDKLSIADVLSMSLLELSRKTGLSPGEAARARGRLLGVTVVR
jgi:hypothetical protein